MEEIWKPVPNSFSDLYEVSNLSRVRRIGGQPLVGGLCNGYRYILLCNGPTKKNVPVHRLVALAFIPQIEGKPCIDHINGIRSDNRIENLRWCTHEENSGFASKNIKLTRAKGEDSGRSKLTVPQVQAIRSSWPEKNLNQLASIHSVSRVSIANILLGNTWLHITPSPIEQATINAFTVSRRKKHLSSFQKENFPEISKE